MKIEALLDKRERSIVRLIHLLKDEPKGIHLKEACQTLDLSRVTLLRYLEGINQEFDEADLDVSIAMVDEVLHYHRGNRVSSEDLLGFLVQSTLKYQILVYLFENGDFTIQELAQELLISEASLSRQLAFLNKLLAEFDIGIRTGHLKGSELQIRYFYFHLFWYSGYHKGRNASSESFLSIIERFYDVTLTEKKQDQLRLWLAICQRRMRLGSLDFQALYEQMKPYQDHRFYERLRNLCYTVFGQWAGSFQEGEVMCHFVFLFFMFTLPAAKVEQMLAFGGPIKAAATRALHYLKVLQDKPLYLNEESLYQINQLFGQAYFFKGRLFVTKPDFVLYEFPKTYLQEGKQLYELVLTEIYDTASDQTGDLGTYVSLELTKLMYYLTLEMPKQVLVGLSLAKDRITVRLTLDSLRKELEHNRSILIEEWQENKAYDLIISDYGRFEEENVYLLHHGLSQYDVVNLREILKTL